MRSRADAAPAFVYVPDLARAGSTVRFPEEEGRYVARVCRARVGEQVTATDGQGRLSTLRLLSVTGRVTAEVERTENHSRTRRAWVWCGAPEGERADWLVEKLAELGVEAWQPLECEREPWTRAAARHERWQRLAVAAMRQSLRPFLMEVREPIGIEAALEGLPAGASRWLASATGATGIRSDPGDGLHVGAVGPASGLTEAERASFDALGFQPICLSDGRLRTETAALGLGVWWSLGRS